MLTVARRALEAVERNDLPKAVESLYTYFDCFGPSTSIGEVKPVRGFA